MMKESRKRQRVCFLDDVFFFTFKMRKKKTSMYGGRISNEISFLFFESREVLEYFYQKKKKKDETDLPSSHFVKSRIVKRRKPWCDDLSCNCHISGNRSNKRPRVSFSPTIKEEHDSNSEGPISEHRHFIKELKDEPFDLTWEEDVPPLIWRMISDMGDAQIDSKQWVDQVLKKIDGHPAARTMLDTFAQIRLPVGDTPWRRRSPVTTCSCIWCSTASEVSSENATLHKPLARQVHCSVCGQAGHNKRTHARRSACD